MSRKIDTGVYSQSTQIKYSFNFKRPTHDSFMEIKQRLEELSGGHSWTKTEVMEWLVNLGAHTLKKQETLAVKRFNTQQ